MQILNEPLTANQEVMSSALLFCRSQNDPRFAMQWNVVVFDDTASGEIQSISSFIIALPDGEVSFSTHYIAKKAYHATNRTRWWHWTQMGLIALYSFQLKAVWRESSVANPGPQLITIKFTVSVLTRRRTCASPPPLLPWNR